jgi:hypothetical protein
LEKEVDQLTPLTIILCFGEGGKDQITFIPINLDFGVGVEKE